MLQNILYLIVVYVKKQIKKHIASPLYVDIAGNCSFN